MDLLSFSSPLSVLLIRRLYGVGPFSESGRSCGTAIGVHRTLLRPGSEPEFRPIRRGWSIGALIPCIGGDLVVANIHLDPSMNKAQTESHVGAVANFVGSFPNCPSFLRGRS